MKKLIVPLLSVLLCTHSIAFSPDGPPPKKTVEWTVAFASMIVVPRIEFDDSVILGAGLDFLEVHHGIPAEYAIKIDGSALGETRLRKPIHLKAKNTKIIDALAKIADQVQAKLIIDEGVIRLVPKDQPKQNSKPAG